MKIKVYKEHISFNKKIIKLIDIKEISNKGLILKNDKLFKLTRNELIKVLLEINKKENIDLC